VQYICQFYLLHLIYIQVHYIAYRLHVLYIYEFYLLHLLGIQVHCIAYRLHVLYIYQFYLVHLLGIQAQFIYDDVIYKLKRYKSHCDLYLFITSFTTSMCYTFICFTLCTCLASNLIASLT
jgi:hypothetical protein